MIFIVIKLINIADLILSRENNLPVFLFTRIYELCIESKKADLRAVYVTLDDKSTPVTLINVSRT